MSDKKKEALEIKQLRESLKVLNDYMNAYGATQAEKSEEQVKKTKLYELMHPETPHLVNASQSRYITDRSETCCLVSS